MQNSKMLNKKEIRKEAKQRLYLIRTKKKLKLKIHIEKRYWKSSHWWGTCFRSRPYNNEWKSWEENHKRSTGEWNVPKVTCKSNRKNGKKKTKIDWIEMNRLLTGWQSWKWKENNHMLQMTEHVMRRAWNESELRFENYRKRLEKE